MDSLWWMTYWKTIYAEVVSFSSAERTVNHCPTDPTVCPAAVFPVLMELPSCLWGKRRGPFGHNQPIGKCVVELSDLGFSRPRAGSIILSSSSRFYTGPGFLLCGGDPDSWPALLPFTSAVKTTRPSFWLAAFAASDRKSSASWNHSPQTSSSVTVTFLKASARRGGRKRTHRHMSRVSAIFIYRLAPASLF